MKKAQDLLNLVLFLNCSLFVLQRWSRRRGSNPRPQRPERCALPTALRLDNVKVHINTYVDFLLVEATGLEPTTSWSLTKRATKLRYASILPLSSSSINYYTYISKNSQAFFCLIPKKIYSLSNFFNFSAFNLRFCYDFRSNHPFFDMNDRIGDFKRGGAVRYDNTRFFFHDFNVA